MGKVNMRYLDAHESSSHDYSAVTRTDQEDTSQCWCLTDFGIDTFTIQQRVNMKFLDAHEGSNDHSAVMRDDQGNDSQKWIISAEPTATAANGQSWTDSQQVCTNQGKQLCTFDKICPNGEGSTPVDGGSSVGHDWSPMLRADGVTNDWVHISGSGHTNCKPHGKYHGLPGWGTQPSNIYNHRIYCCDQGWTPTKAALKFYLTDGEFDNDQCLQSSQSWGSGYTCATGTSWCTSWAKDMQRCCPNACGTARLGSQSQCDAMGGSGQCVGYPPANEQLTNDLDWQGPATGM